MPGAPLGQTRIDAQKRRDRLGGGPRKSGSLGKRIGSNDDANSAQFDLQLEIETL